MGVEVEVGSDNVVKRWDERTESVRWEDMRPNDANKL